MTPTGQRTERNWDCISALRLLGKGKTAHFRTEQNLNVSVYVFCLCLVAGSWLSADAWEWKQQSGRSCFSNSAPHVDCSHFCKTKKLKNVHGLVWKLWGRWPGCCSLTPSPLASFSVTNRRLPAKLFPNRWICFLQQGAFLFFVLNKAKYHCCLSLQHSAVYFTPRAVGIPQEDKLPYRLLYSLPAAPQITSAYVHTLF